MKTLEQIKNDCDNLKRSEKENLIEYLTNKTGGSYKNSYQSNCKHYNTTWYPRQQTYKCRDCGEWSVSTKNDRWK